MDVEKANCSSLQWNPFWSAVRRQMPFWGGGGVLVNTLGILEAKDRVCHRVSTYSQAFSKGVCGYCPKPEPAWCWVSA